MAGTWHEIVIMVIMFEKTDVFHCLMFIFNHNLGMKKITKPLIPMGAFMNKFLLNPLSFTRVKKRKTKTLLNLSHISRY